MLPFEDAPLGGTGVDSGSAQRVFGGQVRGARGASSPAAMAFVM